MTSRALIPRMPTLFYTYTYTYTLRHATTASPASSLLHTSPRAHVHATNERSRRRVFSLSESSGCRPVTFTAGRWRVLAGRGHGATRDDDDVYALRVGCDLTQEGIGSAYVVVVCVGSRAVEGGRGRSRAVEGGRGRSRAVGRWPHTCSLTRAAILPIGTCICRSARRSACTVTFRCWRSGASGRTRVTR